VAHEALIRGWERLRGWLNQDREFLLWRQRLDQAQVQWEQVDRDPGSLRRGTVLTEAEGWLHRRPAEINAGERTFIQAGLDERTREQQNRERRRQNLIWGLAAGFLIAIGTALFVFLQWDRAETQAALAAEQTELAKTESAKARKAQLEAEEQTRLAQRGAYNLQLPRVSDLWRQDPGQTLSLLNDTDRARRSCAILLGVFFTACVSSEIISSSRATPVRFGP